MKKAILYIFFSFLLTNLTDAQSLDNLKEINQVWDKFYLAFDSLDYRPMKEIHSKDLIRIGGGKRISDYTSYTDNYKTRFEKTKENKVSNQIALRFFERINNDSIASERGIYKLIRIDALQQEKVYYGQFHVIFKKENGAWKIFMDYDSTEGGTIGEDDFIKAHGIDEFDPFIEN